MMQNTSHCAARVHTLLHPFIVCSSFSLPSPMRQPGSADQNAGRVKGGLCAPSHLWQSTGGAVPSNPGMQDLQFCLALGVMQGVLREASYSLPLHVVHPFLRVRQNSALSEFHLLTSSISVKECLSKCRT